MSKRSWSSSRCLLSVVFSFLLLVMVGATALAARIYRVQPGDTLYQIAHYHALTTEELVKANQLATTLLLPDRP